MNQSLWYLRFEDKVIGPFPAPQIKELLEIGEVGADWEISLDGRDWLTIRESGQFESAHPDWVDERGHQQQAWRAERERARNRWLHGEEVAVPVQPHDLRQDAQARRAASEDHDRTERLVHADQSRRASPWMAVLALMLIALVGGLVWFGQQDKSIEMGISRHVANCAAPLAEGVNWSACAKQGVEFPDGRARNARMERARLDDAKLPRADLGYAILRRASLRNADLQGASLVGADLAEADLTGADLAGADLRYASLKGARLEGTRLDGARLDKATWVDGRACGEGAVGQCP